MAWKWHCSIAPILFFWGWRSIRPSDTLMQMQGDGAHIAPVATSIGVALITTRGHRALTISCSKSFRRIHPYKFQRHPKRLALYHVHSREDGNEIPHTEMLCGVTTLWVTQSLRCSKVEHMYNYLEAEGHTEILSQGQIAGK